MLTRYSANLSPALSLMLRVLVLCALTKVALAIDVNEAQTYSLLAKPSQESLNNDVYLASQATTPSTEAQQVDKLNSMSINKDDQFIMQDGKIKLLNDTQMQILPNGVSLKVPY